MSFLCVVQFCGSVNHSVPFQNRPRIAIFSKMKHNEILEVLVTTFVTSFVTIFGMFCYVVFQANLVIFFLYSHFWKIPNLVNREI